MLFFSMIIFCLLLMTNDSNAFYEEGVYHMVRDNPDYYDYFDITYTISSDGTISYSGEMGKPNSHTEATFSDTFVNFKYWDADYYYIPIISHDYAYVNTYIYKVPKNSTFYCYNDARIWPGYRNVFYCDQAYTRYQNDSYNTAVDFSAGSTDYINWLCSYGLCPTYSDSTLSTLLYPTFEAPYIALPNDNTNDFVSGEFSQFMVVSNDSIEQLYFHLEANPSVFPITNKLYIALDESSPYYLDNYSPEDGGKVFLISKFLLPDGYSNDTPYDMWLDYVADDVLYSTEILSWTTSFSSNAIENDRIRYESGLSNEISTVNNFIQSDNLDVNDYDLPTVTFDFNQEHFLNDLFTNIRNAFTGDTYTDFVFTFPFSGESITIPSNYIESHIPSVILNLIRLFYWYIISRFMLKDVFRSVDKMRQGDWFLRSESNIKTEVL